MVSPFNEMPLAALKMEFRVNDGMASERINYLLLIKRKKEVIAYLPA